MYDCLCYCINFLIFVFTGLYLRAWTTSLWSCTRVLACARHLASSYVTPRSGGYGDVTVTYLRRSKIPLRIYAKHQYRKESECESKWCIIHSNIRVLLQGYHQIWHNITIILHHQYGANAKIRRKVQVWTVQKEAQSHNRKTLEPSRVPRRMGVPDGLLEFHATAAPLWSATERIRKHQAPEPGHEDSEESELPGEWWCESQMASMDKHMCIDKSGP